MNTWSNNHIRAEQDNTLKALHKFIKEQMPKCTICPICRQPLE